MSFDSIPGKISCNKNLNFLMSVKVSLDKTLTLIALIKSSHSFSKPISVSDFDLYVEISLPATDKIVFNALKPQS